ncbi:MAG TPA: polyprenyl synthetase family protein [bacterium]|nr:polyprenyl synthetase family protein [bacterium]
MKSNMNSNRLESILGVIERELSRFEDDFARILKSDVNIIDQIGQYISNVKGKRIRPAIVLLSAKLFGEINQKVIHAASIVELLHTATLIHDDVVDKSDQRRGQKSVNNIWQNKTAVLMGDFLFSRSLVKLLDLEDKEVLSDISQTTEHLSSGELLQIEKSQDHKMTKSIYDDMIFYKTASLFATSCRIGARLMGAGKNFYNALYNYGRYLGMAFQIKDDLFDIKGRPESIGKPVGMDVKQNMLTLPVIHALETLSEQDRRKVQDILARKDEIDEKVLTEYVKKAGGFEYCRERIDHYSAESRRALAIFKNSAVKNSLMALIDFNKNRKR